MLGNVGRSQLWMRIEQLFYVFCLYYKTGKLKKRRERRATGRAKWARKWARKGGSKKGHQVGTEGIAFTTRKTGCSASGLGSCGVTEAPSGRQHCGSFSCGRT